MIRARFKANSKDPRPINWPIKHPYWISGYGSGYAIIVAYADDQDEIIRNWPEAREIDAAEVEGYVFTDRFAEPAWFVDQQHTTAAGSPLREGSEPK